MKTNHIAIAVLCATALFSPTAHAEGCVYAGDVNEVRSGSGKKEVMRLGLEYVEGVSDVLSWEWYLNKATKPGERERYGKLLQEARALLPQLREAWKAAILAHPEQVNDLYASHELGEHTPLLLAVQANDEELVSLLLNMGAIPFLSTREGRDAFLPEVIGSPFPSFDGVRYKQDAKVAALIQQAREGCNLHEICLRARQAGHVLNEWTPKRTWKPRETDIPAKTGERAYLYEDDSRNGVREWALNSAACHFSNHIVAVTVVTQREEGDPRYVKPTILSCRVDDVINGDTVAGAMVEYRFYPEDPVQMKGRRLIICADDIKDGKVAESAPCVYSRDTHFDAFMQVKADRQAASGE